MTERVRIVSLHVYPVKGCRAVDLARAAVAPTGLQWDRNWMFVDEANRFLSQRECPGLALVDVRVADDHLVFSAAGHPDLRCPIESGTERRRVTIWRDTPVAGVSSVDTRDWLGRVTGVRGQLVRGIAGDERRCDPAFTGADVGNAFFADAYSLLVANVASLAALNERLPEALPMNRFRPNLVVEGAGAFEEDHMTWLRAGPLALKCVKPCTRCIVTTTDQRTGARRGEEPLRTLRRFRWLPALKGVAFGMNAIVTAGAGSQLAAGQDLDVEWHPRSAPARWALRAEAG